MNNKAKPDILINFVLTHEYCHEENDIISYQFKVDTSFYNKKGYLSEEELNLIAMYAPGIIDTMKFLINLKISRGKTYIPITTHSCYDFYFSSEWDEMKKDRYIINKLSNIPYQLNSKYKVIYPNKKTIIGVY